MFSKKRISRFDPDERELSRYQTWLQRWFPERQIIVRSGERMRTLKLSGQNQLVMTIAVLIFSGWMLTSSGLVMNHNEILRAKNTEITDARSGYEQLLAQLNIYQRKIDDVVGDLEKNYSRTVALSDRQNELTERLTPQGTLMNAVRERKPSGRSARAPNLADATQIQVAIGQSELLRTRVIADRESLRRQLESLQGELVDLSRAHSGNMHIDEVGLEMRQVILERDLARSERDELQQRLAALEEQLSDMESTQLLLFHQFTDLADGKIDHIEAALDGTGLEVNDLLTDQRSEFGQGGPFMPIDIVPGEEGPLHASLQTLNGKVDQWTQLERLISVMPLAEPVERYWITSGFGIRIDPITKKYARHGGLDFGGPSGSPILSTGEGKVVYAGWRGRYGRLVEVDHGLGLRTRYGHLREILVEKGEPVGRGTPLGIMGSSGRSTGRHLHYEVRVNGKAVDPLKYIRAGKDVL